MGGELETNLPPFLLRREVKNWRLKNQQYLQEREQRWQKAQITSSNLEAEDLGNMGLRYKFQTQDRHWQILLGKNKPEIKESIPLPDEFFYEFELRQQFPAPKTRPEVNRQQTQDFLAANWEKIVRIFYSNYDNFNWDNLSLPVYTNVKIDDDTIIDFIAFGPDKRVFVFNFGQQNKNLAQKVEDLFRLMKLKSHPPLTIIDGLSSFTAKENNLILTFEKNS